MESSPPVWSSSCILVARLIFAAVFAMAVTFKLMGIDATAAYIGAAGLPMPVFLAWCAVLLELVLVLCFVTGAFFTALPAPVVDLVTLPVRAVARVPAGG